jgi:hypothetical protein
LEISGKFTLTVKNFARTVHKKTDNNDNDRSKWKFLVIFEKKELSGKSRPALVKMKVFPDINGRKTTEKCLVWPGKPQAL